MHGGDKIQFIKTDICFRIGTKVGEVILIIYVTMSIGLILTKHQLSNESQSHDTIGY